MFFSLAQTPVVERFTPGEPVWLVPWLRVNCEITCLAPLSAEAS